MVRTLFGCVLLACVAVASTFWAAGLFDRDVVEQQKQPKQQTENLSDITANARLSGVAPSQAQAQTQAQTPPNIQPPLIAPPTPPVKSAERWPQARACMAGGLSCMDMMDVEPRLCDASASSDACNADGELLAVLSTE